jgi:serine/threonine protein kinase
MELKPDLLIDGRYRLIDRLGDGAMGQVWRAQDTRFESRTVAVKFLREDQTLGDDAERRQRMVARLNALSAVRPLDLATVIDALASALGGRDLTNLRGRIEERLAGTIPTSDAVAILFDEFSNDPARNENARLRAKLRRLFRDEANSVANLRHDNVVSIFDYGEVEATPYLVMDYIEGRTLHQIIDQKLNLSLARKLQLIEDLCCGLSFAHSRRLVHRDIKPANLIIDQTTDSLKILDFGVVRRLGTDSTVGIPIGTFCLRISLPQSFGS